MVLSDALILPVSQLQTRQVMAALIRSRRIFVTLSFLKSNVSMYRRCKTLLRQ